MKNFIKLTTVLFSTILIVFISACEKKETKETNEAHSKSLEVAMTKSADTVKANIPTTFTFTITGTASELSAITSPHCEIFALGSTKLETIVATAGTKQGEYKITKTFTEHGNYDIYFRYTHDGTEQSHKFLITVH